MAEISNEANDVVVTGVPELQLPRGRWRDKLQELSDVLPLPELLHRPLPGLPVPLPPRGRSLAPLHVDIVSQDISNNLMVLIAGGYFSDAAPIPKLLPWPLPRIAG